MDAQGSRLDVKTLDGTADGQAGLGAANLTSTG
jgi:hypothetical protein